MLDQLLRSASGEVRIKVTGASLERFLNLCMRHNIRPRALHRQDWDCLECTLSLADLRRLRPKMGRTGCRVHILRKSGLPFILRQLRRRAVFTLGRSCKRFLKKRLFHRCILQETALKAAG